MLQFYFLKIFINSPVFLIHFHPSVIYFPVLQQKKDCLYDDHTAWAGFYITPLPQNII